MSTLSLISLTGSVATFEMNVPDYKSKEDSSTGDAYLFIGQGLQARSSFGQVAQITKIQKFADISKEKVAQVKLKVTTWGNFQHCSWQNSWQLLEHPFITPQIWEINPKLSSAKKKYPDADYYRHQQYNFIPTVQDNERVVAGQKLGFVELEGDLFWLIVPNYQTSYRVKIKSGQFTCLENIGELTGQSGTQTYDLTLRQPLHFLPLASLRLEKMWLTGLLFDLFCPILVGSRTILANFSQSSLQRLVDNLKVNFENNSKKVIVVTDLNFLTTGHNTFCTNPKHCLALAQYFVLCGFEVVLMIQTAYSWQEILNFFGNFTTTSEETASLSLFYVPPATELETLPYFHNFWTHQDESIESLQTSLAEQKPDLVRSFAKTQYEDILKNSLSQQNSILVNQNGVGHQSLPTKPTEHQATEHPVFQLLFSKVNSENGLLNPAETLGKMLILWQFWQWFEQNSKHKTLDLDLENLIVQLKTGQISFKKAKEQAENWL